MCVIGAGPTGITATRKLEELGYSTILFEANDKVGGRTIAFEFDGVRFERHMLAGRGSSELSGFEDPMHFVQQLIEEVGFPFAFEDPNYPVDPLSPNLFAPNGAPVTTPEPSNEFLAGMERYMGVTLLDRPEFFVEGIDKLSKDADLEAFPELALSLAEWLEVNNLSVIAPEFMLIPDFGYGTLEDGAALYHLKIVSPQFTLKLGRQFYNYEALFQELAAPLLDVRVSCGVTNVTRQDDGLVLRNNCGPPVTCKQVVAAFSPVP